MSNDKFTIGDSHVTFEGPDVIIKGVRYRGTPSSYELLFKDHPIADSK